MQVLLTNIAGLLSLFCGSAGLKVFSAEQKKDRNMHPEEKKEETSAGAQRECVSSAGVAFSGLISFAFRGELWRRWVEEGRS